MTRGYRLLRTGSGLSLYTFSAPVWDAAQRVTDGRSAGFACKRKQGMYSRCASIHNNVHISIKISAVPGNEEKYVEES